MELGRGLNYTGRDSTFFVKFRARIQNRYDGVYKEDGSPSHESRFYLKRARIKFDGWALNSRLVYKFEIDVVGGYVRDAYVRWNFYRNVSVLYGLAKLPGNHERITSSQFLEFVDRSLMNDYFNLDRDNGIQLLHHWNIGNAVIRESFAYSHGRGINDYTYNPGASYTGRLEILPLGKFEDKGDIYYVDFRRERTPKLMIGLAYNLNDDAIKDGGQLGRYLTDTRDLQTAFADVIFKYRGITASGEVAQRSSSGNSPVVSTDSTGKVTETFRTGYGYNCQIGYLLKSDWEIAVRYTEVVPEKLTQQSHLHNYTLGFNKYFNEHYLKLQSEISYLDAVDFASATHQSWFFRTQLEISF